MSTNAEFTDANPYTQEVIQQLLESQTVNGIGYFSTQLELDHPHAVNAFDPDRAWRIAQLALYWPEHHPTAGTQRDYEMLSFETDATPLQMGEATSLMRQLILDARVSQAAIDRISDEAKQGWERFKTKTAAFGPPVLAAQSICNLAGVPLTFFAVQRPSGGQESTDLTASLYYPHTISPKPVLITLKRAIRALNRSETI